MADIIFPLSSAPGRRQQEGGGRLINAYAERLGDGARDQWVRRRVPGLLRLMQSADYKSCRGLHEINNSVLAVMEDRVIRISRSGGAYVETDLGALSGSGRVTIASNNAATPDIVAVTEDGAFNLFVDSAPTSFADADLPNPNSVCFIAGYFIFTIGDGRAFASDINDVAVDALDFTTAETRRDGLLRGIPFGNLLLLCGQYSIEVFQNTGNPTGFPLSFVESIPKGIASTFAIAGHEEGWANALLFVGDDNIVYRLQGYTPVPVSTHDVVRSIEGVADKRDLDASVYMSEGHAFWSLSGPGWTWEYNLTTGNWHERESYDQPRWRGRCTVKAWDQWVCGDWLTGDIFSIRGDVYREGDLPLVATVQSVQGDAFPSRIQFPRAEFDIISAVGRAAGSDPMQTRPRVSIRWSDDGGYSWSNALLREIGAQGDSRQRVIINRTGLSGPQGRQWELSCADDVYFGVLAGAQAAIARTA